MAKGYKKDESNEFERSRRKTEKRLAQLERYQSRKAQKESMAVLKSPSPKAGG